MNRPQGIPGVREPGWDRRAEYHGRNPAENTLFGCPPSLSLAELKRMNPSVNSEIIPLFPKPVLNPAPFDSKLRQP